MLHSMLDSWSHVGTLGGTQGAQQLLTELAQSSKLAKQPSRAGEVAAYGARLHALRAALHAAVRSASVQGVHSTAAVTCNQLFEVLLSAWEEIKVAEEQKASEEAEMFKTKVRKIATEEVRV